MLELPKEKRRFSKLCEWYRRSGFLSSIAAGQGASEYDNFHPSPPTRVAEFAEVRHILNIAQVHASSKDVNW